MKLKRNYILVLCCLVSQALGADRDQKRMVTGVEGGLVVVIGCKTPDVLSALRPGNRYVVQGLDTDAGYVNAAIKAVKAKGIYGPVSARLFDGKHLPYADNLINQLVISDTGFQISQTEVMRVLVPGGTAIVNGVEIKKEVPQNIDSWSHHLHGPDGNPVAKDEVVGPPARFQWIADPKYQREHESDPSINALVSAGGRVFYLVDEAPISLVGEHDLPDKWSLLARDAFNGIQLWKIRVEDWGWRTYKDTYHRSRHDIIPVNVHRRVVATDDRVYATLGMHAPVSEIDAATGKVLRTYPKTEGTREILYHNGDLVLSIWRDAKLKLAVIDAAAGNVEWETGFEYTGSDVETEKTKFQRDAVLNPAIDGDTVCFIDSNNIVCFDRNTGKQRWSEPLSKSKSLTVGTLIVHDGVVLYTNPGMLKAISAAEGNEMWTQRLSSQALWFRWKDVFVINGVVWTWGPQKARDPKNGTVMGYDLNTGKVKKEVLPGNVFRVDHHHRCYRNKATSRYLIASRRGAEFMDLVEGNHTVHNWIRGICHYGMMPANGLLYAPPEPCRCYRNERITGFVALAPEAYGKTAASRAENTAKLVKGPAYSDFGGQPTKAGKSDWPAFRADGRRSSSTKESLPANIGKSWEIQLPGTLSAPIAVSEHVYVTAVDAHTVCALQASSGRKVWEYTAGGRVDSPPAYYEGRLLFGCTDGWVTCLRASDGALVWRFLAAPEERLIGAFSQLESAWPVHGSVLIHDDVAYFAAGRSSYLDGGIHVFALDPKTGKVLHQTTLSGPKVDLTNKNWYQGYSPGGGPGALNDIFQEADGLICMRNKAFDAELKQTESPVRVASVGGYLDDTYFKRYLAFYGSRMGYEVTRTRGVQPNQMKSGLSQILVNDDTFLYGTRMFDDLINLSPDSYFVPVKDGYLLFKIKKGSSKPVWSNRVPVRVKSMVVTPDQLIISGAPDMVDPKDPLGAFEARKGGRVWTISSKDGRKSEEYMLDAPPVFNGMAVARGRLFVSQRNGKVVCLTE